MTQHLTSILSPLETISYSSPTETKQPTIALTLLPTSNLQASHSESLTKLSHHSKEIFSFLPFDKLVELFFDSYREEITPKAAEEEIWSYVSPLLSDETVASDTSDAIKVIATFVEQMYELFQEVTKGKTNFIHTHAMAYRQSGKFIIVLTYNNTYGDLIPFKSNASTSDKSICLLQPK